MILSSYFHYKYRRGEKSNHISGLSVEQTAVLQINEQFSKMNVEKFIESMNAIEVTLSGEIANHEVCKNFETVQTLDGSFRVFHKKTAF